MSFTLSAKSWTQNQIPTRAQPPTGSSHSRHMAGTQFKLKPQPKPTVNPTLSFSNHRWTPSLCSSTNEPSTTPGGQEGVSDLELAKMSSKLAKLGLAAVLAYGLFDGVTYTSFFVLAFLGYEKSTGNNPAANLKALLGIVVMMWTGNNITRPFRVAGAAALAPFIDKGLKRIQELFKFPHLVYAFSLVVAIVTTSCFTVVGLLILSRWGK